MLNRKTGTLTFICLALFLLLFTAGVKAQRVEIKYGYKVDLTGADKEPVLFGFPEFNYPDTARKNGVEGTVEAVFTMAEDGTVKDLEITRSLPDGVDEAIIKGLQTLRFSPAKWRGDPVAVKMFFNYTVSMVYSERDKNVQKPKILSQPDPVYPPEHTDLKGEVSVQIMFYADGTLRVLGVNSVMPKEFDNAAVEAAARIEFEPATHKKSKKPVTQQMTVEYKFKP